MDTVALAPLIWFWATTGVLATLLFFPVRKLIWVSRVRRLERKNKRPSTPEEKEQLRNRSRIIAGIIAITFSFLFNSTFFSP